MKILRHLTIFSFLILFLNSCNGKLPGADARKYPPDPKLRVKKNIEEGRGFRLMDGIGNSKGGGDFEFASLEVQAGKQGGSGKGIFLVGQGKGRSGGQRGSGRQGNFWSTMCLI